MKLHSFRNLFYSIGLCQFVVSNTLHLCNKTLFARLYLAINYYYVPSRFIEKIRQLREEGRKVFYLDESFVNAGICPSRLLTDCKIRSARQAFLEGKVCSQPKTVGKGRRLIIAAVMSVDGLVEGTELIWESGLKDPLLDYHREMNSSVFETWLKDTVLPKLPDGSVLVMGKNLKYCSRILNIF